jgi:hypothetical protein
MPLYARDTECSAHETPLVGRCRDQLSSGLCYDMFSYVMTKTYALEPARPAASVHFEAVRSMRCRQVSALVSSAYIAVQGLP